MNNLSSQFGATVRKIRLNQKMTIDALVKESGVSKGNISKIENGLIIPNLKTIQGIAKAFGLSVSYLMNIARL